MRFLLFILLFISCTTASQKDIEIVEVNLADDPSEGVTIEDSTNNSFGKSEDVDKMLKEESPKIALTIYSSIYHSLAFLPLIKELEKKKIKLNYVSSQGFGALIAALYAKEASASYLEWKLFDLMKKLRGKKVYSEEWNSTIVNFTQKEFKESKLDQLKVKLLIPEIENRKIVLNEQEKVVDAIRKTIDFKNEKNYFNVPDTYLGAIDRVGVDLNLSCIFIPEQVKFNKIDGYNWGVITKYLGMVMRPLDGIYQLKTTESVELDAEVPLSDLNRFYQDSINNFTQEVSRSIGKWKEENTNHLNN